MNMYNPPHPGEMIEHLCIKPLRLTITEVAKGLGVSRKTLSELINGHSGVSIEMALRLSMAFGGDPCSWLMQQIQYDLWVVKQGKKKFQVRAFKKAS